MSLWPPAWRANLPWAGVATGLTQVGDIHGVQIPALGAQVGLVQQGTWQLVSNAVTPTAGPDDVFTVTGQVLIRGVVGIVTTPVARAAGAVEAQVGTAGDPDAFLGTVTDIRGAAGSLWLAAGATLDSAVEAFDLGASGILVGDDAGIVLTVDAAPDSGEVTFICWWMPLTAGSSVVAA